MSYDVRALANLVLDRADELRLPVTNIHINKILYFLYVWYLLGNGRKLTTAKIEAWDYGPVFREIYQAFKKWGNQAIIDRAMILNLNTGEFETGVAKLNDDDREVLIPLIDRYLGYKPFDLVELTHRKNTPWDVVYNHGGRSNPGMCISDDLIVEYYAQQTRQ